MADYRPLSDAIYALIHEHVHSIEQIELLLLLRARAPSGAGQQELARELTLPEELVRPALEELRARRLLTSDGSNGEMRFRFAPDPTLQGAVAELAEAYQDRRVEVLRLVSANAFERMRSASLKLFAEAFRLRRGS